MKVKKKNSKLPTLFISHANFRITSLKVLQTSIPRTLNTDLIFWQPQWTAAVKFQIKV